MGQLEYQRRRPVREIPTCDSRVFIVPGVLPAVGMAIFFAWFLAGGLDTRTSAVGVGVISLILLIYVICGIAAAFITATIAGVSFGVFWLAVAKLAGILTFTTALGAVIPFGGILVLAVYLGLLVWQFEMDIREALLFAFILWIVRTGVSLFIITRLFGG